MIESPRRRFGLSDQMILVAATAFGLAPLSITADGLGLSMFSIRSMAATEPSGPINTISPYVLWATIHTSPLLSAWGLAALVLSLRRPRPSLSRLARYPGFLASLAVGVASAFTGISIVVFMLTGRLELVMILMRAQSETIVVQVGFLIIGAWQSLAIGGHWRLRRPWTDRLGCVIGMAWLFLFMLYWVRIWSSQFSWM